MATIVVCELGSSGLRELALNGLTRRRWERVRSAGQSLTTSLTARVYTAESQTRVVAGGETIWRGQLNAPATWHELARRTRCVTVYLTIDEAPVRSLAELERAARRGYAVAARGQLRS